MAWPAYYPTQGTVRWRVENTTGNLCKITRTADGVAFTTSQLGAPLNQTNVMADVIRRAKQYAGSDQAIFLEAGHQFDAPTLQSSISGKAGDDNYAYWGNTNNGPFQPIQRVHFVSDPSNRASVRNMWNFGTQVKSQNSTVYSEAQLGGKLDQIFFFGLNFHLYAGSPSKEHHFKSPNAGPTSHEDVQGWIGWYDCTFTGEAQWMGGGQDPNYTDGRGYDCMTPIRVGFGSWEAFDCVFPTAGEHVSIYGDAPQGFARIWFCTNTSSSGISKAICGRNAIQFVQRGLHPENLSNHGGLPGVGEIHIKGNTFHRTGWKGGSAFTIAGFVGAGGVTVEDNQLLNCYSGYIVVWTSHEDGGFTNLGAFEPNQPPFIPQNGQAWTTDNVTIRTLVGTAANATSTGVPVGSNIPRSGISIRGTNLTEIEFEGCSLQSIGGRPIFQFWGANPNGGAGGGWDCSLQEDPLDNFSVRFVMTTTVQPVSTYAGWGGATSKARYKKTDLLTAQLDALAWPNLDPAALTTDIAVNTINLSTSDVTDEPEIAGKEDVIVGWNHRTAISSATLFSFTAATWTNGNKTLDDASFSAAVVDGTIRVSVAGTSGLTVGKAYRVASKTSSTACVLDTTDGSGDSTGDVDGDAMGDDMDQRFRVYTNAGVSALSSEARATVAVASSQWRPLISPILGPSSEARWLYNFTDGPNDNARASVLSAATPFALVTAADLVLTDTTGRRGENDGFQLSSGNLMVVWNQVEGSNTTIRRRFYDNAYSALAASAIAVSVSGKNCLDPRIKGDASRVWLTFHAQDGSTSHSNEYDGMSIWAAVWQADGTTAVKAAWNVTAAAGLTGIARRPEVVVYDWFGGGKALLVWEHYPNGTIDVSTPSYPLPVYTGPSHIYVQAFDNTGTPITAPIQVNTAYSAGNSFAMRPDIDVSVDGTEVMICWTAATTCPPNGGIYSPASTWRLWARILDLSKLTQADRFPMPEFRIESNQTLATNRSWTRVCATNYLGLGGWAFTYRFGNDVKARFFNKDGSREIAYPPGSVVGGGSQGSVLHGFASARSSVRATAVATELAFVVDAYADARSGVRATAVATPLASLIEGYADARGGSRATAVGTVTQEPDPPAEPSEPATGIMRMDAPSFEANGDAPKMTAKMDAPIMAYTGDGNE